MEIAVFQAPKARRNLLLESRKTKKGYLHKSYLHPRLHEQIDNRQGVNVEEIKEEINDISTIIVLALQPFLVNSFHSEMRITDKCNQSYFHLFGLDLLLDEDLKCWVMEINCFPSFSYFHDKIEIDPVDETEKQVKVIAEFDLNLKPLIIKDTLNIVRTRKVLEDLTFIQVFPPPECQ